MNPTAVTNERTLLTDGDLCRMLQIGRSTLRRYLKDGPPRQRHGAMAGDIRTIEHVYVGSQRRWLRRSVMEFIEGADR